VTLVGLTPGSSDRDGFCTSKPTKSYLAGLGDPYFWSPRKLRAYAISLLAGDIAERLIYRSRKYGAGSDHGKVVDLALAVAADSPDPLVSKWVAECEILVEQNRAAIGQVAEALLASDRLSLTGREIRDLMAGA
jgi:hypothetical protein